MDSSSRYLLLTGATGLIGSQLLARLLRRHVPICVLVRSNDRQSERCRIESILKRFETSWGQRLARPTILVGDLTHPDLGLSHSDYKILANECSSVIHLAASLSFRPASRSATNEPYRTNVDGTRELLSLCAHTGIDNFHYVSTAYVCGSHADTFCEDELEIGQSFSNDYEHSKLLAERLLRSSDALTRLTVYRPSIVIDTTGNSPSSPDRTIYVALSLYRTMSKKFGLMADGNWYEFLGCTGVERKNLVEASWVADVIDGIVENESLHGRTYNLTSQYGTSVQDIEAAFKQVIGRAESPDISTDRSQVARAETAQPHRPVRREPNAGAKLLAFSKNAITRGARTVAGTIAGPYLETFSPYFRNDPVFDRRNLNHALASLKIADSDVITADTIARFGRIQEAELSTSARGQSLECSIDQAQAKWVEWLEEYRVDSRHAIDEPHTEARDASAWGVWLVGPQGGDWRIELKSFRVTAAGQCCMRRVYTDVETWGRLLNQQTTLDEVVNLRRLSFEIDGVEIVQHEIDWQHQLAWFLSSVRERLSARRVESIP